MASNSPIGSIVAYAGTFVPSLDQWEKDKGWLLCNGRPLNRTDAKYKDLFDAIGSSWGGDGVNMFNLPDLLGYFLRGVASGSGRDPDVGKRIASKPGGHVQDDVGSVQDAAMQSHTHLDSGHTHGANTTVHGRIPTTFSEQVEHGDGDLVNGNEGGHDEWMYDPGFTAATTITAAPAKLGDASPFNAGAPKIGNETRPANAYVYWIIKFK
jgi:microcystin-dependent protein